MMLANLETPFRRSWTSMRLAVDIASLLLNVVLSYQLQKAGISSAIALSISRKEQRIIRAEMGQRCVIMSSRVHKSGNKHVKLPAYIAAKISRALNNYTRVGGSIYIKGYPDKYWGLEIQPKISDTKNSVVRVESSIFGPRPSDPFASVLAYVRDTHGLYFDGRRQSDFEILLDSLEPGFWKDQSALNRLVSNLDKLKFQKYPEFSDEWDETPPGDAILIVGQVTGDAATTETVAIARSNIDLVRFTRSIFPDRPIYYKAHPYEKNEHDIIQISTQFDCKIIPPKIAFLPLCSLFKAMVTITSGAGLEAALCGVEVHTLGVSFYSHRGFTVDHCHLPSGRRKNKLGPKDIYAAFVGKYAQYIILSKDKMEVIPFEKAAACLGWVD